MADEAIPFTLNGRELEARPGELLIAAAERHGVEIPHFCYHPRMRPVGMCRMCLVEVDTGRGPSLQPACMLEVSPGMVVDTEAAGAAKAQEGVLEFLLLNHPLDCPVCDKGGECPLQDQTMAWGPGESRLVEEKRHYDKPIAISDLVLLDRERCILCDRCTRFAKEVAGDPLIHFQERGNQTQVNTFPDHPFASYFSGNTVQICPVGALTATSYRFKARPWDLEEAESTCTTCALGCRVAVQSSRDRVLRVLGVDVDEVNWGWLCDKGRFGFEAVDHPERLAAPVVRRGDALVEVSWADALDESTAALRRALESGGPSSVGVIGGARCTNESAYAWAKLAKGLIGTDNVDAQLGDGLPAELVLGVPRATIDDACRPGGTVLLVNCDPKEDLPVLFLRLRHAVVNDGVTLVEVNPRRSATSPLAALSLHPRPGEVGRVVRHLAGAADGTEVGGVAAGDLARGAALLAVASGPVTVIVGRASLAEQAGPTVDAVGAVLAGLGDVRVLPALRRANVTGALEAGLAPGMLPGGVGLAAGRGHFLEDWPALGTQRGLDTSAMLTAAAEGRLEVLVTLGADLFDGPDPDLVRRALARVTVVCVDLFETATTGLADVVLPAAGWAEVDGTTTNVEGRVSPVARRVNPPGTAREDWMIAAELAWRLDAELGLESVDQIRAERQRLAEGAPPPVRFAPSAESTEPAPIDAYSLRLVATRRLYDGGTLVAHAPSLTGLAAGTGVAINPYDFDRLGVAAGDRVRVSSARAELFVEVVPDDGVPRGCAAMVVAQPGVPVTELVDADAVVNDVRVETVAGEA